VKNIKHQFSTISLVNGMKIRQRGGQIYAEPHFIIERPYNLMNFRVSHQYSDLPSDIITGGITEKDVHAVRHGRVAEVSVGMRGERTIREGGKRTGDLFY